MSAAARASVSLASLLLLSCNMDSSPALENATTGLKDSGAEVVPAQQAVTEADLAGIDLETMNEAEFTRVVDPGPHCSFAYTTTGNPVLVAAAGGGGGALGVIKIHGSLAEVTGNSADHSALRRGGVFQADGIAIAVKPFGEGDRLDNGAHRREADLLFRLKQGLRVGYGGFYTCAERGLPNVE